MKKSFFAGLTHAAFMRQHWQKKPLLVRNALPEYANIVTRADLIGLAERDDVESRLVQRSGARWNVRHGPFRKSELARLPRSGWTLLVQSVDQLVPAAAELLRRFAFIPYARLDDVMVSYAARNGGVGAHFDSYDVFLVQGSGERRWGLSRQDDLDLVADAPLKLLRRFEAEQECIVGSGDVLYVPPLYAHDGVAVADDCVTYPIGFRAPSSQALATGFLEFLQDRIALEGMYRDPDLRPTRAPGRIPRAMIRRIGKTLERMRWSESDVVRFIGEYLTEPKSNVVFERPRTLRAADFSLKARKNGLRLAPASRMLTHGNHVFINGETYACGSSAARYLSQLADKRRLGRNGRSNAEASRHLHEWYRFGYIELDL